MKKKKKKNQKTYAKPLVVLNPKFNESGAITEIPSVAVSVIEMEYEEGYTEEVIGLYVTWMETTFNLQLKGGHAAYENMYKELVQKAKNEKIIEFSCSEKFLDFIDLWADGKAENLYAGK